jgi:hypothetical protein
MYGHDPKLCEGAGCPKLFLPEDTPACVSLLLFDSGFALEPVSLYIDSYIQRLSP